MKKAALIFTLLTLISILASAQMTTQKYEISGKVIDSMTKTPVEYASVALFSLTDSTLSAGCITDRFGNFSISKIDNGLYYLEIRFIGYKTLVVKELSIDKDIVIDNLFLDQNITMIQGVEISSDKSQVEYKIDKQIINANSQISASNGNAIDILKKSPSITVDNEENIFLRGSSDFLLLIDDRIVVTNKTDFLRQITAAQIDNIEIMTNPSAKYDAGGASGIINIKTKSIKKDSKNGMVHFVAGIRNKYNSDFIFKNNFKKLNYQISFNFLNHANYSGSKNELISFKEDMSRSIISDVNRKRNHFNLTVRPEFDYNISSKTRISGGFSGMRLLFRSLTNSKYVESNNLLTKYYIADDDFLLGAYQIQGDFRVVHDFDTIGQKIDFSASYLYWKGLNDQVATQHYSLNEFIKNGLQLNRKYYEDHYMHQFEIGSNYKKPHLRKIISETGTLVNYRKFSCNKSMTLLDTLSNNWFANPLFSGKHEFSESMTSLYYMISGSISKLQIQTGLRTQFYNRITDIPIQSIYINYKKLYYFPSVHISLPIKNKNQWQLSYSKRINLPNDWFTSPVPYYNDGFIIQTGNPYLKPELYDVYELNHIHYIKDQMLSMSVFAKTTHNGIERTTSQNAENFFVVSHDNISNKYYFGCEAGSNLTLNKQVNINITASIFSLKTRITKNDFNKEFNQYSYGSQLNIIYRPAKSLSMEFGGNFDGAEQEAYGKREPMYSFNIGLRKSFFSAKLNISLTANNIFKTYSYKFYEYNESYSTRIEFYPEYPVILIGLTYNFNDYKPSYNSQPVNSAIQLM